MRRGVLVALVMLAVSLGACGRQPAPMPLVMYQRTGGVAGVDEHLTIMPDGSAQLVRRGDTTPFTVDAERLERLQALLEQPEFKALRGEYVPENTCCDLFDYVVQHPLNPKVLKRVHAMDTAVPEALQPVLDLLNEIAAEHAQG